MPSVRRDALAADPEGAAVRRAGRDPQRDRHAPVGRHLDLGAERGLGEGDRHGHGQVVARPAEHRVRGDVHAHVQVAGGAAALARRALALELDPLAVADPGGDARLDGARAHRPAAAGADRARVVHDQAAAAAGLARLGEREVRPGCGCPARCPRRSGRPAAPCRPWRRCPCTPCTGPRRPAAARRWCRRRRRRSSATPRSRRRRRAAAGPAAACGRAAEDAAEDVAEPAARTAGAARRRTGRQGRTRTRRRPCRRSRACGPARCRTASAPRRTPCAACRRTGRCRPRRSP